MIYDYETDETYASTWKEEMEIEEEYRSRPKCLWCEDRFTEFDGFRVQSGEFCCYTCKPDALQAGRIALCVNCGDYFLPDAQNVAANNCDGCR